MKILKNYSNLMQFYLLILILVVFFPLVTQTTSTSFCGKIRIQSPFSLQNSINESSSPLNKMLLCKSEKVYFRTSLGLFLISSIDYKTKTLTLSHNTCSSSLHFVSPTLLSAGFPSSPSAPNSLLLFNCLNQTKPMSSFSENCTRFTGCRDLPKSLKNPSSCWIVDDAEKLEMGFDPKDLNCSHYGRIYKNPSSSNSIDEKYELGTRISFDIPDHIPNICDECTKPEGNCGIGLRCICHPKECKDKVISRGASIDHFIYLHFMCFLAIIVAWFMLKEF